MMTVAEERERVIESIIAKNEKADRKYEKEMEENSEALENEQYEREFEEDNAQFEKEEQDEENRIEPEQVQALFAADPEDGGYSDLWNHAPTRQKIIDSLDCEIAAGAPNDDWRTYKNVGEKFRERKRQLKAGTIDEKAANREDLMNQLAAQSHREMIIGNEYADAEQEDPQTPEEIRRKFTMDNPDFSREEILDAAKAVDQAHREQYVKQGYSDNSYRTYEEAAEIARHQQVLRERNQE